MCKELNKISSRLLSNTAGQPQVPQERTLERNTERVSEAPTRRAGQSNQDQSTGHAGQSWACTLALPLMGWGKLDQLELGNCEL